MLKAYMAMELEFGAQSDVGSVRENNEDSYRIARELNVFVLSDGMGGLEAGEVASRLAVDSVVAHSREAEANPSLPMAGPEIEGVSPAANRLASAIRAANTAVHEAAQQAGVPQGMGATVVAIRIFEDRAIVAHVGDSRAYRLRGDDFQRLTRDHSFVAEEVRRGRMTQEEADTSRLQNVLMRALGIEPEVEVDVTEELLMEGDTLLLCSDGLTRELSDPQIAAVLQETSDAPQAASRLVQLAKQAGGGDNITAIALRHAEKRPSALGRFGKWFRKPS